MALPPPKAFLAACCLLASAPPPLHALGGAGAPEVNPSALVADVYVNPAAGSDTAAGNATAPYRTLAKGLWRARQFNDAGQGVTVHLAPGVYLEGNPGDKTAIYFGASTAAPIVIQGQGWSPGVNTGDVIITGSEVWTDWDNDGGGVWSRPWPYQMPIEPGASFGDPEETIVPEVIRLMSGVFVNGEPYYIFRSATDPDLARLAAGEGAYWVDLGPDGVRGGGDDRLRVKPPAGLADLNAATVRVTTRGNLLHFWRPGAQAAQPAAVVFRNLVFEHSGASAIIVQNHGGAIVEDCVFRDNKWRGVTIESAPSPATVRRCVFTGNGEQTIATRGRGMLYEDLLIQNNARQAYLVRYFGWGAGAFKIGQSSDCTFRRIRSLNNWGLGAWFDTGNVRCELADSVIAGNSNTAVFIENNNSRNIPGLGAERTVEIRNCAIVNNTRPAGETWSAPGVQIGESENAAVRWCLIAGNNIGVRILSLAERGPQRNNQFADNIIAATSASQALWGVYYGLAGWRSWFDTLDASTDRNAYHHPNSLVFLDRNANTSAPLSLASWRGAHLSNIYNTSDGKAVDGNSAFTAAVYTVKPLVSIAPLREYISEAGGAVAAFRVFRLAADISAPLTIGYTARADAGDAVNGTDYAALPGAVTVPAGALYADIVISPAAGDGAEPLEPVVLTLQPGAGWQLGAAAARVFLDDEAGSLPSVGVAAAYPVVAENGAASGAAGRWTFTRTGAASGPLTAQFSINGTAAPGADYAPFAGTVTFPAGASEVTLDLLPVDDAAPEVAETVSVAVAAQPGVYGVADGAESAAVTILDDDILSVAAINVTAPSGGSPVVVPVTIRNPAPGAVTFTISPPDVPYTWGASSLNTAPPYEWVEIIHNSDPGLNGTMITPPGVFVSAASPAGFTEGGFTWKSGGWNGGRGYSGGWLRAPLPNTAAEASRGPEALGLGFAFPFYGQNYTALYLHTNGFLSVTPDPEGFEWNATAGRVVPKRWFNASRGLPSSDEAVYPTPRGAVAGFWEDMAFLQDESKIYYKAFPDRFVVTFENMGFREDTAPYASRFTFQIIASANGTIDWQYQRADRPLGGSYVPGTAGLTSPDLSRALLVSYKDGFLTPGQRVQVRPQPVWASASNRTVTIPGGGSAVVQITLDPAGLADGIHSLTIPVTSNSALIPAMNLPVSMGVGELAGALSFAASAVVVAEDAGSASLTVNRMGGFTGAVSVSWRIGAGGNATAGQDFAGGNGTITWPDGDNSPRTILAPVLDDLAAEGDEFFVVELFDPVGGASLGSPASVQVIIRDNDQPVGAAPVLTAAAVSPFQVNLSWTSVTNAAAFRLERSTDGGATWQTLTAGLPAAVYSYTDTGLPPGAAVQYRLRAFNAAGATAWAAAGVTTPAAGALAVTFARPAAYENEGQLAGAVTRPGPFENGLTVYLSANSARVAVPPSVTIPAGQASANFTVTLLDDADAQGADSQVVVTASVPGTFARDSFDYPAGAPLHGATGGYGWGGPWNDTTTETPKDFVLLPGNLAVPGWGSSGNYIEGSVNGNGSSAYRDLAVSRSSGVFYAGVALQLKPGTYPSDLYVGFDEGDHNSASNWMDLRFRLLANGTLEAFRTGYNGSAWTPTGLSAGANNQGLNLLVVKVDYGANNAPGGGDDSMRVWLNPPLGNGEPEGGFTVGFNMIPITRISLSGWWKDARFDEVRFAETYGGLTASALGGMGQFALRDNDALSGVAAWRNAAFGSPGDTGPAAPGADPDGDLLPNLLEYALGGWPAADGGHGIVAGEAGGFLTITFTHRWPLSDAVIEVEGSSDLEAWTPLWSSAAPASPLRTALVLHGNGSATTTVRDTVPLAESPSRALRLRVTDHAGNTVVTPLFAGAGHPGLPEIEVTRGGAPVVSGSGLVVRGATAGAPVSVALGISNTGGAALRLSQVFLSGNSNCAGAVTAAPDSEVPAGGSTPAMVEVTPAAPGPWAVSLAVYNNDADENPFRVNLSGYALPGSAATLLWQPGGNSNAGGTWDGANPVWKSGGDFIAWQDRAAPCDFAQFGAVTATRAVVVQGLRTAGALLFPSLRSITGTDWVIEGPGTIELAGPALVDPATGYSRVTINATLSGSAGLTLNSSGARNAAAETLLGGNNTYTGVTRVYNSTLRAGNAGALGASGPGNETRIIGTGRLLLAGPEPVVLPEDVVIENGAGLYGIRVSEGNHTLTGSLVVGQFDAGPLVNGANATLILDGNVSAVALGGPSFNRRISLTVSGGAASRIVVRGVVADAPDGTRTRLLVDGSGNGPLSGIVELAGNNTFSGDIALRRGTLLLTSAGATGAIPVIYMGDGGLGDSANTLRLLAGGPLTVPVNIQMNSAAGNNTYTGVIGGATAHTSVFTGRIDINDSNNGTYQLTAAAGGQVTFSGLITDNAGTKALVKTGSGTVALARAGGNTFDGGLTVAGGVLVAANTSGSATGTGAVTVQSGARIGGTGVISGGVALQSGGGMQFSLGTTPAGHDKLDIGGALVFGGGNTVAVSVPAGAAAGNYTLVTAGGGITGAMPELTLPPGWAGSLSVNGNDLVLALSEAGYPAWAAGHALTGEAAAENADPDGDGVPNLVEYLLGGAPADSASRPALVPGLAEVGGEPRLTLTFTPQNLGGVRVVVQASGDLADWTDQLDVTDQLTAGQPFTFTDTASLRSVPRRFLRLVITVLP